LFYGNEAGGALRGPRQGPVLEYLWCDLSLSWLGTHASIEQMVGFDYLHGPKLSRLLYITGNKHAPCWFYQQLMIWKYCRFVTCLCVQCITLGA
jgi:hypothetical protein